MSRKIKGIGVVTGIATGKALLIDQNLEKYLRDYEIESKEIEKGKLKCAIDHTLLSFQKDIEKSKIEGLKEQADILTAYCLMIKDPAFNCMIEEQIEICGSAPEAVLKTYESQAKIFEKLDDEYLRGRAIDLNNIGKKIVKVLLNVEESNFDEKVIIVGEEIEPSTIIETATDKIAGIIFGSGSITSHTVIIAKTRGIPTIVGVGRSIEKIKMRDSIIFDSESGEILIQPTSEEIENFKLRLNDQERIKLRQSKLKNLPARTIDGNEIILAANIGDSNDIEIAKKVGAQGVGLFRSELIFINKTKLPTEEEQFRQYKYVIENCENNLCVIRTLDIGGDKPLSYIPFGKEKNPFLGYRAIRISLQREDLFISQLKAILRAGFYGRAAIMFPMITTVKEFLMAEDFVQRAKTELDNEKKEYSKNISLGIMVETPASAVIAPILAKYVDFFSIGTNDLIQYVLAVDRGNTKISYLYNQFDPAVLRLIKYTIDAANNERKWVGVCGEMASDPDAAVILLAMGVQELSMSASFIPRVKERIRSVKFSDIKKILDRIMSLEDGNEIENHLKKTFENLQATE